MAKPKKGVLPEPGSLRLAVTLLGRIAIDLDKAAGPLKIRDPKGGFKEVRTPPLALS